MSILHETSREFLHRIIAHCNVLAERYRILSAFLLDHPAETPQPELSAQLTVYTLANWNLTYLSEKLEQASNGERMSETVNIITFHLSLLSAIRSHALRRTMITPGSRAEETYTTIASDMLRAILGEVGEDLLAPTLARYVQMTLVMRTRLHSLGRRRADTVEDLKETANVLRQLSEEACLDRRYAVLADELLALVGSGRSPGRYRHRGLSALSEYISSLSSSRFVAFIAQLFAESFAGYESESIEPISLLHAALRLVNRHSNQNPIISVAVED